KEISRILNAELGPDAAFEQHNIEYNYNYYVNLSQYSGQIPDDLNHFSSISTYGWVFYEPICFTKSLQYYPLTLNADSNETKERIITSLENEGVIINKAIIAHIVNCTFNDSSFEKSSDKYENILNSDDVAFIVKSFFRG
ncbi:MAG: hypothetical protein PHV39_08895, partial [Methanomicrobium sp.]|nr:hypothetical protein [Methanomicrobium sp.]